MSIDPGYNDRLPSLVSKTRLCTSSESLLFIIGGSSQKTKVPFGSGKSRRRGANGILVVIHPLKSQSFDMNPT